MTALHRHSVAACLEWAQARLSPTVDDARFEAQLLLAQVLQVARTHLLAWPEKTLTQKSLADFRQLVERRRRGVPLAYLRGRKEFWSLSLAVSEATLIPRPETERLVEVALQLIADRRRPVIADLGTGSGAVALAIASERADARVLATDLSAAALQVASGNAQHLGLRQCRFAQLDWCNGLGQQAFDLIVSNPPYVESTDPALSHGEIRFEPQLALSSGSTGMQAIERICRCAGDALKPGGWLALEHGWQQQDRVKACLEINNYRNISGFRDLAGHDRVCIAQV